MNKQKKKREKGTVNVYAYTLNMSEEGLRYYEQKGIIAPKRDELTGYRVYGGDESFAVISCRKYRRYGIALDTVRHMLIEASPMPIIEQLKKQREEIEREIAEKQRRLLAISDKISQIEDELTQTGRFSIVIRPAMYWIKCRQNQLVVETHEAMNLMRKWNGSSPYTDHAVIWSLQKLRTGEGDFWSGHVVEEEKAELFDVSGAGYLPQAECLYTVNESGEFIDMCETIFDEALNYARSHDLALCGDAVARQVRMYTDAQGKYHYISQIWIPVQQKQLE